jgi:hypothetical protein
MTASDDGERAEILAEMAGLVRKLGHDPDPAAQLQEEVASLRECIDDLRRQLAAQGHGCCHYVHWYPYYPSTVTVSAGTGTAYYTSGGGSYSIGGGPGAT